MLPFFGIAPRPSHRNSSGEESHGIIPIFDVKVILVFHAQKVAPLQKLFFLGRLYPKGCMPEGKHALHLSATRPRRISLSSVLPLSCSYDCLVSSLPLRKEDISVADGNSPPNESHCYSRMRRDSSHFRSRGFGGQQFTRTILLIQKPSSREFRSWFATTPLFRKGITQGIVNELRNPRFRA